MAQVRTSVFNALYKTKGIGGVRLKPFLFGDYQLQVRTERSYPDWSGESVGLFEAEIEDLASRGFVKFDFAIRFYKGVNPEGSWTIRDRVIASSLEDFLATRQFDELAMHCAEQLGNSNVIMAVALWRVQREAERNGHVNNGTNE